VVVCSDEDTFDSVVESFDSAATSLLVEGHESVTVVDTWVALGALSAEGFGAATLAHDLAVLVVPFVVLFFSADFDSLRAGYSSFSLSERRSLPF
jgi:hypothetical protein